MTFRPSNARPTNVEKIVHIDTAKVDGMSPEELSDHRMEIIALKKHLDAKLRETATGEPKSYDEQTVRTYIEDILDDGFNLNPTALSAVPGFQEAQQSKQFKALIAELVEASPFGEKHFKIHDLRLQRSAITRSKTLHQLRQNVALMIGPLKVYRELQALKASAKEADKCAMVDINTLLEEIEEKDAAIEERERILYEVRALYEPVSDKAELLQQIEDFKAAHGCSDKEAGKFFGKSDRTVRRLRQQYGSLLKQRHTYVPSPLDPSVQLFSTARAPLEQTDEEFFSDFEPID